MLSIHPNDCLLASTELQQELLGIVVKEFGGDICLDELKCVILDDMQTFRMTANGREVDVKLGRRLAVEMATEHALPREYLTKYCSGRRDYNPDLPLVRKKLCFSYATK